MSSQNPDPDPDSDAATPRFRSGAVARMAGMPVATLRIWERRYQVAGPATTASGHRLYSQAQVERLALLRQLTDAGHAIGTLAGLDGAQLQRLQQATPMAAARLHNSLPTPAAWRIVVVGAAFARRLQRASMQGRLGRPLELVGVFDTLAQASRSAGAPVDALLVHAPGLHADTLPALKDVAQALGAARVAVLYRFAATAVCEALAAAQVALLRAPQTDAALARWATGVSKTVPSATPAGVPMRRYSDAALAELALLPSGIACECPRHLAELLLSLTQFESYSADCQHRTPADAALHSRLAGTAGRSRAMLETALDELVAHEGLVFQA